MQCNKKKMVGSGQVQTGHVRSGQVRAGQIWGLMLEQQVASSSYDSTPGSVCPSPRQKPETMTKHQKYSTVTVM